MNPEHEILSQLYHYGKLPYPMLSEDQEGEQALDSLLRQGLIENIRTSPISFVLTSAGIRRILKILLRQKIERESYVQITEDANCLTMKRIYSKFGTNFVVSLIDDDKNSNTLYEQTLELLTLQLFSFIDLTLEPRKL